jgi:hypothetical protein
MDTICNLCKMKIELPGLPIIGEEPRQRAGRLTLRAVEHLLNGHPDQYAKLHHGASQYLSVLILGCFDLGDEILKQDAATAREFADKTLNPTCETATASTP